MPSPSSKLSLCRHTYETRPLSIFPRGVPQPTLHLGMAQSTINARSTTRHEYAYFLVEYIRLGKREILPPLPPRALCSSKMAVGFGIVMKSYLAKKRPVPFVSQAFIDYFHGRGLKIRPDRNFSGGERNMADGLFIIHVGGQRSILVFA